MYDPYESFYHGLVTSKLWLCIELEKIIDNLSLTNHSVKVLGGWHNLMSFMMIIRKPTLYTRFDSYDKDPEAKYPADRICNSWLIEEPHVHNHVVDVNTLDFSTDTSTIYINCSVDQFPDSSWYETIPSDALVCLQTTDITDDSQEWEITQKTGDLAEFKNRYPMTQLYFEGSKSLPYKTTSYNRLMLIGRK